MGRACVQELLTRSVARERASDSDWKIREDGVFCRAFPEGLLIKKKLDDEADEWFLWWLASNILHPLDRGPLADIECDTREVIRFGPPGGPDDGSSPRVWCPDEGSLFATALRGCFRLMVRPDDRGTLIFVRDDYSTIHLGDDSVEELKRTADSRLREHCGDPIRGWIGRRRFDFHGLGVHGVIGQVELMRDTWLVLVRAGDDRFDLYMVGGGQILDRVGSYTGSALTGGDLGQLFDRHSVEAEEANGPAPASNGSPPRRTPPHHTGAPPQQTRRATPPPPATLSADQLGRIEAGFSPTGPFDGLGASEMGALYAGLRVLLTLNLPNMRLRTGGFRKLMMKEGKQQLGDCAKTFVRAAERVLEATKFGTREGRWWNLPFADVRRPGAAVDRICEHFEPRTAPTAPSSVAPPATTVPPSSSASPPPAAPPVSSTAAPVPAVPPSAAPPAAPAPAVPPSSASPSPAAPPVSSTAAPAPAVPPSAAPPLPAEPSVAPPAPTRSGLSVSTFTPPVFSTQPTVPPSPTMSPTFSPPVTPIQRSPAISVASSIPAAAPVVGAPPEPSRAAVAPPLVGDPGLSPTEENPPLETGSPEVEVDQAPYQTAGDEHWHRVIRRDGRPTFYEPLFPRDESDDAPSRFKGAKPRGPPPKS